MSSGKYGLFDLIWVLPALAFEAAAYAADAASACTLRIQELNRQLEQIRSLEQLRKTRLKADTEAQLQQFQALLSGEADQTFAKACTALAEELHRLLEPFLSSTAFAGSTLQPTIEAIRHNTAHAGLTSADRLYRLREVRSAAYQLLPQWQALHKAMTLLQAQHTELLSDLHVLGEILGRPTPLDLAWRADSVQAARDRIVILTKQKAALLWELKNDFINGPAYIRQQEDALNKVSEQVSAAFAACQGPSFILRDQVGRNGSCVFRKSVYRLSSHLAVEVSFSSSGQIGFEIVGVQDDTSGPDQGQIPDQEELIQATELFIERFPAIQAELKRTVGLQITETIAPSAMPDLRVVNLTTANRTRGSLKQVQAEPKRVQLGDQT